MTDREPTRSGREDRVLQLLKRLRKVESVLNDVADAHGVDPASIRAAVARDHGRAAAIGRRGTQDPDGSSPSTTRASRRVAELVLKAVQEPASLAHWPGKAARLVKRSRLGRMLPGTLFDRLGSPLRCRPVPVAGLGDDGGAAGLADPCTVVPLAAAGAPPGDVTGLRMALVSDHFTAKGLEGECLVESLHPDSWAEQVNALEPHVLFVESAWQGASGEWAGKVAGCSSQLRDLVASCRAAGIRTVFWNKEDPLHFEAFIQAAHLFEHVFTTDAGSIPRYKRELGHHRVHVLPFAYQPRMHGPVAGPGESRSESAFFAGAWYGDQPERCRDFKTQADALLLAGGLDIFDRNHGNTVVARQYPERYRTCIRGSVPYASTPGLYRGYRLGLTLNTIKESPTMFARRAIEMMGAGTSVYSNYCRALRLMFGDLVVSSDDGEHVLERAYEELAVPRAQEVRWRRLVALRKVLLEHAWDERLRHMLEMLDLRTREPGLPRVTVLGSVEDEAQAERMAAMARSQAGVEVSVCLRAPAEVRLPQGVARLEEDAFGCRPAARLGPGLIAPWHADDTYGSGYLLDMCLARKFANGPVVGKAAYFHATSETCEEIHAEQEYSVVSRLALRRLVMPAEQWPGSLGELLDSVEDGALEGEGLVSIDALSYLQGPAAGAANLLLEGPPFREGLDVEGIRHGSDALAPLASLDGSAGPVWSGAVVARMFAHASFPPGVSVASRRHRLELVSRLSDGQQAIVHSQFVAPGDVEHGGEVRACLDAPVASAVALRLEAMDGLGSILESIPLPAGTNIARPVVPGTAAYRLTLVVTGAVVTWIDGLWTTQVDAVPLMLPGHDRLLVVVNGYPSAEHLYRNAFVHRRVLQYRLRGVEVDVVWVSQTERHRSYEFDGVDVVVCDAATLRATLARSSHASIAVHFLDETLWSALSGVADSRRMVVWLHGAEIQPWTRRRFNHGSEEAIARAREDSDRRTRFWTDVMGASPESLHFVFVSRTFAEQTWEDLGFRLPDARWSVIPNPIDTNLFRYARKGPAQRRRILSIRPHASRIYANDLVAGAIEELSTRECFSELAFTLVGDGPLWEENFERIRGFQNVTFVRRFLSQREVADLHRSHGVFLVPSRGDTQGVSRDEAMASGLVPVTNSVGSILEFVDGDCAVSCVPESAIALADAIERLYADPMGFERMSEAASLRVARTVESRLVVPRELAILDCGTESRPGEGVHGEGPRRHAR